jgi:hypothetical protein
LGDAKKFAELLSRNHPFVDRVLLWSPGGSVEEALKSLPTAGVSAVRTGGCQSP